MALTLGRSKKMTDLSFDQLAYLAGKARIPEKLVLREARETVERFLATWKEGQAVQDISSKAVGPVKELLARIPLIEEVSKSG